MEALCTDMLFEMKLRNFSRHTMSAYLHHVKRFAALFERSPIHLGEREVREYLFELRERRQLSWSNVHIGASALKFLYRQILRRPLDVKEIPRPKDERRLPIILSVEEVLSILKAAGSMKHRAILMTTYGAGLRLNEVTQLRLEDIDRERMLIRIRQGKGKRDRYTLLPKKLLRYLNSYRKTYRPTTWLFPGLNNDQPIANRWTQQIFYNAKKKPALRNPYPCILCAIASPHICWRAEPIFL